MLIALTVFVALGAAFAVPRLAPTEPILIGFLGTLSGPGAHNGMQCVNGALLAVEDCNSSGGIRDHSVQLELHDDEADPATASEIVASLAQREAWAIIGPTKATVAQDAALAAKKHKTLLISPVVSTDAVTATDDSFASVRVSLAEAAENIARHLRFKRNLVRTTLVFDKSSAHYFDGFQAALLQVLNTSGISSAGVFSIHPDDRSQPDYVQLANRVLGSGGDSVLVFAGAAETAMLVQHLRVSGCESPVITYEPSSMADLVGFGGLAIDGITVITSIDPNLDSVRFRAFCDRFHKRFGRDPDIAAVHSYEATRVALTSIVQATGHEDVRRAMLDRQGFDGMQGRISMGNTGSPKRELRVLQLRNGTFTEFE